MGRGPEAGIKYEKWMAYLTNWGYLILSIQSVVGLGLLVHYFINYVKGNIQYYHLFNIKWCLH